MKCRQMVRSILSKININKKGVYILEASIVIPTMFMVMVLLISVIPVIASAENALFVMGDELKIAGIKSAFTEEEITTPIMTVLRLSGDSGDVYITDYDLGFSKGGIDELIAIEASVDFSDRNPLGGISRLAVKQKVMARCFTGSDRRGEAGIPDYENSRTVYVFPNRGEKYHRLSCPFLNPACHRVILTADIKSRFGKCSNCHSQAASLGDIVYCFFNDGKVYHLGSCSAVDKYYIEMEQKDAEARGYTACITCGG